MIKRGEGVQLIHTKDRLIGIKTQTASEIIYEMNEDVHIHTNHSLYNFPFLYKDNVYRLYVSNLKYSREFPQDEEDRHSGRYYYVDSGGRIYTVNLDGDLEIRSPPNYDLQKFSCATDRNQDVFTMFEDINSDNKRDLYIALASDSGIRVWKNYTPYFNVSMSTPSDVYFDGERRCIIATDSHQISLIDLDQDVEDHVGEVRSTKYVTEEIKGMAIDIYGRYWVLTSNGGINVYNVIDKSLQLVNAKSVSSEEAWGISESVLYDVLVLGTKDGKASYGYVWTKFSDYSHSVRASIGHGSQSWSQLFPMGDYSTWVFGWGSETLQVWDMYTQEFYTRETQVYPLKGDPGLARSKSWKNLSPNRQPLMDYLLGEIVT